MSQRGGLEQQWLRRRRSSSPTDVGECWVLGFGSARRCLSKSGCHHRAELLVRERGSGEVALESGERSLLPRAGRHKWIHEDKGGGWRRRTRTRGDLLRTSSHPSKLETIQFDVDLDQEGCDFFVIIVVV